VDKKISSWGRVGERNPEPIGGGEEEKRQDVKIRERRRITY